MRELRENGMRSREKKTNHHTNIGGKFHLDHSSYFLIANTLLNVTPRA